MRKILHWIAHKLRWNYGTCEAYYDNKGRLMISFVCTVCGKKSNEFNTEDYTDFDTPPLDTNFTMTSKDKIPDGTYTIKSGRMFLSDIKE